MKIKYAIFCLSRIRKIYDDDEYHVLGELITMFDTEKEAEEYVMSLQMHSSFTITIMKVFKT